MLYTLSEAIARAQYARGVIGLTVMACVGLLLSIIESLLLEVGNMAHGVP